MKSKLDEKKICEKFISKVENDLEDLKKDSVKKNKVVKMLKDIKEQNYSEELDEIINDVIKKLSSPHNNLTKSKKM